MKLWIDDLRPAPDGYNITALNYHAAIAFIDQFSEELTHISFDNDLGSKSVDADGNELSGYMIADYLEENFYLQNFKLSKLVGVQAHSSNYWGREKIISAMQYIAKNHKNNIQIYNTPYESMTNTDSFGFILNKGN